MVNMIILRHPYEGYVHYYEYTDSATEIGEDTQ